MENGSAGNATSKLDEFTEWVNNFCDTNHIPGCAYKKEYDDILNIEYSEVIGLEADECFAKALLLMNYATYLHKKYLILESQLDWCNQAIDFLCAKQWNKYDKFLPAEIKKQTIIANSENMLNLEKIRIRFKSSHSILKDSYHDVKRRVSLLEGLGKKKSFN